MRAGTIDTGLIERELAALTALPPLSRLDLAAAAAAVLLREAAESARIEPASPWDRRDGWSMTGGRTRRLNFRHGDERRTVLLRYGRDGLAIEADGESAPLRFAARRR